MGLKEHFEELEEMLNWVSDRDREWWPFLFLRPQQHERMGTLRVLALSILHGVFVGMLANIFISVVEGKGHEMNVLTFPLATTLGFFVFYRFTFAYFWNRRAARLLANSLRNNGNF
jgi:hypothetical protein